MRESALHSREHVPWLKNWSGFRRLIGRGYASPGEFNGVFICAASAETRICEPRRFTVGAEDHCIHNVQRDVGLRIDGTAPGEVGPNGAAGSTSFVISSVAEPLDSFSQNLSCAPCRSSGS